MTATPQVLVDGFVFTEGPRWHDGSLWFSDMHGHAIHRIRFHDDGQVVDEIIAKTTEVPSGLGWLADGSLIFVAMESQRLMRVDDDGEITEHADCSALARGSLNDMIVRSDGTAFVGDMGFHIFDDQSPHRGAGQTIRVTPAGEASLAADDLGAPNGHVLSPDEKTLYVAESSRGRITAFDVADDGSLSSQRVFAELPPATGQPIAPPDGICLDEQGAIWAADPLGRRLIRVLGGGEVTDVVEFAPSVPVAVVLGGPQRRTLFACVADDWHRDAVLAQQRGRIEQVSVSVSGAGRP
jgi:sugar lactone lactonase YvrE